MPSPDRTAARPCSRRWNGPTCSSSRSTTAATGTATTISSPTCCERDCRTSSPTSSTAAPSGERVVRGERRTGRGDPSRGGRRALRECRGAGGAGDAGNARDRREATLRGWLELLPEELFPARPVLSNGYVGALLATGTIDGVESRPARRRAMARRAGAERRGRQPDRRRRRRRVPPAAGRIAVHRAGQALVRGDSRHRHSCPAGARPVRGGRPPRARSGCGADRARVLGERRSRGGARRVRRLHGQHAAGRAHLRRARLRHHPGGHPDRPGPPRATRCAPTSRPYSSHLSKTARCCGEPRTCTWE